MFVAVDMAAEVDMVVVVDKAVEVDMVVEMDMAVEDMVVVEGTECFVDSDSIVVKLDLNDVDFVHKFLDLLEGIEVQSYIVQMERVHQHTD